MFRLVEARTGLRFERRRLGSWSEILTEAQGRRIDATTIAQRTPDRERYWAFTEPYIDAPTVILARSETGGALGLGDLDGLRVGLVKGYAIDEYLTEHHPELRFEPVPDDLTGLQKVSLGELDAMIADLPTAGSLISKWGIPNLRVAGQTGHRYRYSIAVRADQPLLLAILEKGLASVTPTERDEIHARWMSLEALPFYRESRFWVGTLAVIGLLLLVLLLVTLWNRGLQREVARRTRELDQATARLQQILDAATQVAIVATWPDGLIRLFNVGAERMLGWSSAEVLGVKSLLDLHLQSEVQGRSRVLSERYGRPIEGIEAFVATPVAEGDYEEREWTCVRKDGSRLTVSLGVSVIRDDEGQVSGYLAVAADITARKHAERQLREGQRMEVIGQLAGGVAHDFNNMLAGIIGASDVMEPLLPDEPEVRRYHRIVVETAERAARLVHSLLAFARREPPSAAATDVHGIIRDTVDLLGSTTDRRVSITVELAAERSTVRCDPAQVQSALLNLGLNAAQAMPDGGTLRYSSRTVTLHAAACEASPFELSPGEFLEVEVRDTGRGIPPDLLPRVFEPFFTTKGLGEGTGLGLAAVFGTVQAHDGAVAVESEVGLGTSFRVLLPLTGEQSVAAATEPQPTRGRGRILLIDDEEVLLATAGALLEALGYEVACASDGATGLARFQEAPATFDLVILDMIMPVMNGRDCFAALKAADPDVRVLLSSGFVEEQELEEMRRDGLVGLLRKPYRSDALGRAVLKALAHGSGRADQQS